MIIINDIKYQTIAESTAKLIESTIPTEGQTFDYIPQNAIDNQYYTLSTRNAANVYNIPTDKESIYINFIPRKITVNDSNISEYIDVDFSYFVAPEIIPPELFTLPDGDFFRCVSEGSTPKNKEDYDYYIMVGTIAKKIPNYKTLEVMLDERNQTLLSVRVITDKQCNDITKDGSVPDKSGSWNTGMSDQTTKQILNQLNNSVMSGAALASSAAASAQQQVDAVKSQAAASKAEAEQAKSEADAAKAASEAAIAEANAAKAEAELAIQNNS